MRRPSDLAGTMRARKDARPDGFARDTYTLPRDAARTKAREILDRFPIEAYGTVVERWRELDDGRIEFTMKRLPTAD